MKKKNFIAFFKKNFIALEFNRRILYASTLIIYLMVAFAIFSPNSVTDFSPQESIVLILLAYLVVKDIHLKDFLPKKNTDTIDSLIKSLSESIQNTSQKIKEMENELNYRKELLDDLAVKKEMAEKAINLTEDQVNAIASILNLEIRKENKKSSRQELMKDIILFLLGFGVNYLLIHFGVI